MSQKLEIALPYNYYVNIEKLVFEWDGKKARENQSKHGISFEEAQSVFFDDLAIQFWDDSHSGQEDRFLMLGLSYKLRLLLVVHCFRESDSNIPILTIGIGGDRHPLRFQAKLNRHLAEELGFVNT